MIPAKIFKLFLSIKILDKHENNNNGQLGLKWVPLATVIYSIKLSSGRHVLEVPIFDGENVGVCRLMTELRSRTHCQKSMHYIGEYPLDSVSIMFMP